jgi:hypothetical protein
LLVVNSLLDGRRRVSVSVAGEEEEKTGEKTHIE